MMKDVSRVFKGCFKGVLRVFQGCLKLVSRVFKVSFKVVKSKFQGLSCVRLRTRLPHITIILGGDGGVGSRIKAQTQFSKLKL